MNGFGLKQAMTCVFSCLLAFTAYAEKAALILKEQVMPKGNAVYLQDFVENSSVLNAEQRKYKLYDAPTSGTRSISIYDLALKLKQFKDLHSFDLDGPQFITLKKTRNLHFVERTKKRLLAHLKENAPWSNWEIDVVITPNDEALIAQAGNFDNVKFYSYDAVSTIGSVEFKAKFYDEDGNLVHRANLTPLIMKREKVCALRRQLLAGTVVKNSDIKLVNVWIGNEKKDYITEVKNIVGKELARKVGSGDLVRARDLLRPMCARRGQMIWVELLSGNLSVKLAVKAMEGGRLGDTIRVINNSTKKIFNIELTGKKQGFVSLNS